MVGWYQAGKGGELTHDETTIIAGALELTEKTAGDAMTPIADTFAIDINAKLDRCEIFGKYKPENSSCASCCLCLIIGNTSYHAGIC